MSEYHDGYGDCDHWGEEPEAKLVNPGSGPKPPPEDDGTSSDAFWHSSARHDWKGPGYDLDTNEPLPAVLTEILRS